MMEAKKETSAVMLKQKSHELDDAIRIVSGLIQNVKDDVEKIKNEIRSAFTIQKNSLNHREEQLLRQIDVLSSDEKNFYHTQCAELHHLTGNLESYLHSMEELPSNDLVESINKKIERVKHLTKKQNLNFKFLTDSSGLQSAIQNFGEISILRAMIGFPHFEGSVCLPSKIEYEDEEHHVLYKTLDEVNDKKSLIKYNFERPLLENHEWLSSSTLKKNLSQSNPSLAEALIKINEENVSSVQNWLREMTSADEWEMGCRSEMNSHRCSWSEQSGNDSVDDSIVLLSMPHSTSSCECKEMHLANLPLPLDSEWLSKDSRENVKKSYSSCNVCVHKSKKESLGTKKELERNLWLRKTEVDEDRPSFIPSLKEVCCANETCKNFLECISDENCSLKFDKGRRKSLPSYMRQAIRPMLKIMYSKGDWLSSDGNNFSNKAEARNSPGMDNKERKFEFSNCQKNGDSKNWLHQHSSTVEAGDVKILSENWNTLNRSKWLAQKASSEEACNIKNKISSMFQSYFEPHDPHVWLSSKSSESSTEKQLH